MDINSLESAIDENTAAVIFINPSNPTGAVFSRSHMEKLVSVCEHYKVFHLGFQLVSMIS